jgi:hypothetical protein
VVVLHELEGSLNHGVLEVEGRVESRYLAGKVLTDTKVFGSPPDKLGRPNEAGCNSAHRLLTRPLGAQQVDFNTARKIEAPLHGRGDLDALFYGNHMVAVSTQVEATKSRRAGLQLAGLEAG